MRLVQKFGGTSVGDLNRIRLVADKIKMAHQAGHEILVVVSAMAGQTDALEKQGLSIHPDGPSPAEMDVLMASGEQISCALLSLALQARGLKARSYLGFQVPIVTDSRAQNAHILSIDTRRLELDLGLGCIPVIAGFQGIDEQGRITTLGRGGSDTTAVALAAVLKADECQIYTDVKGVYTADPRLVAEARRLDEVSFEEMLEMSSLGAKVLQIRSVALASRYRVPLRVLSTFEEGRGTLLTGIKTAALEDRSVAGVVLSRDEAKIVVRGIPDQPGAVAELLEPLVLAGVGVDMMVQSTSETGCIDFTFTVRRRDFKTSLRLVKQIATTLQAKQVLSDDGVVKLSLVGFGVRTDPGIALKVFKELGRCGIDIQLVSAAEIKVSVLVDEKYTGMGVRALHDAFQLGTSSIEEQDGSFMHDWDRKTKEGIDYVDFNQESG